MSNISQIDRNFAVQTSLDIDHIRFYPVQEAPFSVFGLLFENGKYRRLPEQVAKSVSQGVYRLHTHTAGGRVKFMTDSPLVAIKAVMPAIGKMPHFALTGSAGFDLYVGNPEEYYASFVPPFRISDGYESVIHFDGSAKAEKEIAQYIGTLDMSVFVYDYRSQRANPQTSGRYPSKDVFYDFYGWPHLDEVRQKRRNRRRLPYQRPELSFHGGSLDPAIKISHMILCRPPSLSADTASYFPCPSAKKEPGVIPALGYISFSSSNLSISHAVMPLLISRISAYLSCSANQATHTN